MGPEWIVGVAIAAFIGLMLIEVPIAFALMASGVLGIVLTGQASVAWSALIAAPYGATAKYDLLVLPMFLLLGAIVANAGIATRIFEAANRLVGWLPGGLAVATVFACTVFGGISGSSAADVATLGRISVSQMRRHGYSAKVAAGVVAAAGTVAILIPPSIPLIIYGILTGLPIGTLLLAGIVPGILTGVVFALFIVVKAMTSEKWRGGAAMPESRQALPDGAALTRASSAALSGRSMAPAGATARPFLGLAYAATLFVIIVGGIYSGLFTSTEAGAMGAFAALLMAVPVARMEGSSLGAVLRSSVRETAETTSMIFALLIGTAIFTYFLALTEVPAALTAWLLRLPVSREVIVAGFLVLLIPLGMFLDGLSMMLLTVPVAYPALVHLGVDGIWLGILIVTMIEVGLITPPVGINVFVIAGLVDDLSLEDAFAGAAPFVAIQLLITAILFAFPQIVLFVPRLAAGG